MLTQTEAGVLSRCLAEGRATITHSEFIALPHHIREKWNEPQELWLFTVSIYMLFLLEEYDDYHSNT